MGVVNPTTFAAFILGYTVIGIISSICLLGAEPTTQKDFLNTGFSPQVLEVDTSLVDADNVFEALGAAPTSSLNNLELLVKSLTFQAPFWTDGHLVILTTILVAITVVYIIALGLFGFGLVLRVFGR